jgi:hypothetical protein
MDVSGLTIGTITSTTRSDKQVTIVAINGDDSSTHTNLEVESGSDFDGESDVERYVAKHLEMTRDGMLRLALGNRLFFLKDLFVHTLLEFCFGLGILALGVELFFNEGGLGGGGDVIVGTRYMLVALGWGG